MKQNAWLWYLAVVVGVGQYYFVSSVSSEPNETLYTVIGFSSLLAVAGGLLLHRPRGAFGWTLILASVALYLGGDAVYASLEASTGFVEIPSSADWLYLAMYPVLIAGVVLVRRAIAPGRDMVGLLDAAVIGVSAFAVIGAVYMNGYLTDDTFGRTAQIVVSAYPLFDVVLIACGAWLVLRAYTVQSTFFILAGAFLALALANAVFNVAAIGFSFEAGGVADLGWLAFTSLLGAAALHPSVADIRPRTDVSARDRSPWGLWVPAAAVVAIPLGQVVWGDTDDLATSVIAFVVATSVLVARILVVSPVSTARAVEFVDA